MPGTLTHSPADVMRWLLIDMGHGTDPATEPLGLWPAYAGGEPATPDEVITVYDTAGVIDGFTMTDGEAQERHGIQIRVRSATHRRGYNKSRAIAVALDQDVYQETVTIDGTAYLVWTATRTTDVLAIGKESPTSKRSIFTLNALVSMRQN